MQFAYAMFADAATFAGGKLHLIGGDFDELQFPAFPAIRPSMAVVAKLIAEQSQDAGSHRIRLTVTNPSGQTLPQQEFGFEVPKGDAGAEQKIGAMFIFELISFPVQAAGTYTFLLSVDETRATHELKLRVQASEAPNRLETQHDNPN